MSGQVNLLSVNFNLGHIMHPPPFFLKVDFLVHVWLWEDARSIKRCSLKFCTFSSLYFFREYARGARKSTFKFFGPKMGGALCALDFFFENAPRGIMCPRCVLDGISLGTLGGLHIWKCLSESTQIQKQKSNEEFILPLF